jgi:hypothetical protein
MYLQMRDRLCAGVRVSDTADIEKMEATVFREQMVNFLTATVVFLLVTNVLSIAATTYAVRLLNGFSGAKRPQGTIERKLNALLQSAS